MTAAFTEWAEQCARDELFDLAPEEVMELQMRWALCSDVEQHLDAIDVEDNAVERALGKPASHSVVAAARTGKSQLQARYPGLLWTLEQSDVAHLVDAPKVQSAGQGLGDGEPIDVDACFERTRSMFDARMAEAADPLNMELARAAWRMGVRATAERIRQGQWEAPGVWRSFAAKASAGHAQLQAFETLYSVPTATVSKGSLCGIPVAIKSLFWVADETCTASSKALSQWKAPTDAAMVVGLRQHGATLLGSVRMDEFAMGGSGARSAFGPTAHPFLPGYAPGGSSSGSAAAVAAGDALLALGSDTGGSVRQPASYCGLWGLKPTWGGLSRFGMVPYSFSLDTPGVFATRCDDLLLAYEAMASSSGLGDHTCVQATRDGLDTSCEAFSWQPKTIRLGYLREMDAWLEHMHPGARQAFLQWKEQSVKLGFEWVPVSIPALKSAIPCYYTLSGVESQSALARYDPLRFGFQDAAMASGLSYEALTLSWRNQAIGKEARMRALLGAMALSEPIQAGLYAKACVLRERIVAGFQDAFGHVDFIVTPTTTGLPPKWGTPVDVREEWSQDMLSVGASLAGCCAISAPWAQFAHEGMSIPLGIQFMAAWHRDDALLSVLRQWETHQFFEDCSVLQRTGLFY